MVVAAELGFAAGRRVDDFARLYDEVERVGKIVPSWGRGGASPSRTAGWRTVGGLVSGICSFGSFV